MRKNHNHQNASVRPLAWETLSELSNHAQQQVTGGCFTAQPLPPPDSTGACWPDGNGGLVCEDMKC